MNGATRTVITPHPFRSYFRSGELAVPGTSVSSELNSGSSKWIMGFDDDCFLRLQMVHGGNGEDNGVVNG